MPRKSRRISNLFIMIGGTFALFLILASWLISKERSTQNFDQQKTVSTSSQTEIPEKISVDTANWKTYRDPIYRFEIKYPAEWANPVSKRVTDPDFDYEYQVSFGTPDTITGNGIEGFDIFVFQTEKCRTSSNQDRSANNSQIGNTPQCSTHRAQVPTETSPPEIFFEFSGINYTYTLLPLIPPDQADSQLVKKTRLEFSEAAKVFSFESSLKLAAPKNAVSSLPKSTTIAPAKPKPVAKGASRLGKITGAISAGGRLVCPHPGRKPKKSPNQGNHVDEDCCPDPDEWPNAACAYKPSDYNIMLKPK